MTTRFCEEAGTRDSLIASVLIPTCNRPELLAACLERVASAIAAAGRLPLEVVVSDDSADDRTRDVVASQYPWVRWMRGPRRGPASNRNAAAAVAAGRWIIFTDDDCLPESDWLRAYFDAFAAHPSCSVFEGKTVADRQRHSLKEESPVNESGGYLWSCNVAIRRELFERLGGFCESFPYAAMEDVDLRLRLQGQGESFPFVSGAVVCHPFRPAKGLRFAVKIGKSYLHLVERHPPLLGKRPWIAFVLTFARRSKQILLESLRCRGRGALHAAASLAILMYFEGVARMRHTTSLSARRIRASTGPSP